MKIAQFIDTSSIGGAETMLVRLSVALKQNNHEVVIFHTGNTFITEACSQNGIETELLPDLKKYKSTLSVYLFSIKFARYLKKNNFDLIHTHLYGPITGVFLGAGLFSIKHVGTLHDVYSVQERLGRGITLRLAQLFGTRLVAVSQDMKLFYQSYVPFCKPISKVNNGIEIQSNELTKDPLSEYSNRDNLRIITVGRMIPLKRQKQQLKAMRDVLRKSSISLFFVGDGPDLESIRREIKEQALENKVFALGNRNDVSVLLRNSDLFILASESEGLSCSIIEAMDAGLPCIVSDVGGNKELIEPSINGFVFDKDNFEQMVEKLEYLIDSPKLRLEMGVESKAKSATSFSVSSMLKNYQTIYKN